MEMIGNSAKRFNAESGIGLILVVLVILVLTVLSAAIIFATRTEIMASNNYKLSTQADYLAKAGIQEATNWLRGSRYQAVSQAQAGTYYNVTSSGDPYSLYTSNTSPVQCISTANCSEAGGPVQLMGIPGTGSTNYPLSAVAANFAADLVNAPVTGDARNSGTFTINAVLLNYQTVNVQTSSGINVIPLETWLITSQAHWSGSAGSATATATEQAIVQPIYVPSWGNALYGYCSVSMQGSSGVCTDAFNSSLGAYGDGNPTVASGTCDSNSPNVITAGAGVGANGSVTVGSNVTVSGNVAIGSDPPPSCPAPYGFIGNDSSVLGQVVQGPHVDPPDPPAFRAGFPAGAPNVSVGANQVTVLPADATWPSVPPFPNKDNPPPLGFHAPCMNNDGSCDGTAAHPFEIAGLSMNGGGKGTKAPVLQLVGGPDAFHPVYYDVDSVSENQGSIQVSGYVVLNVQTSFSISGQGLSTGVSCSPQPCTTVPPSAVQLNAACSGPCITLGGNGAVGMVISAPNADVSVGGGGDGGYFVGAIKALNISVQGGYPVHYDVQLDRANGTIGQMVTTGYTRQQL
jgi:hypothetical protein